MAPTLWGQILLRPHAAGLASPMSGSVGNWGEENGLTWHGPGAFPPPCQATPALEKPIGHSCCLLQKPQIPEQRAGAKQPAYERALLLVSFCQGKEELVWGDKCLYFPLWKVKQH